MTEICLHCDEAIGAWDPTVPTNTMEGRRLTHRECALREVLGGIGHHIAHEYWCGAPRHDPDGGLTRRQSAILVAKLYELLGDEVVTRGASAPASDEEDPLEAWAAAPWGPPGRQEGVGRDVSGVEAELALDRLEPRWRTDPEPGSG